MVILNASFVRLWVHYIIYVKFYLLFFFVLSFEDFSSLSSQEEITKVVSIEKYIEI